MSSYIVMSWSVAEGLEAEIETALTVISDHIRTEHREILSARLFRQFAGALPHRAYMWMEEYESLTAFEQLAATPECDAVWQPIREFAFPGTYHQSVWSDADKNSWMIR